MRTVSQRRAVGTEGIGLNKVKIHGERVRKPSSTLKGCPTKPHRQRHGLIASVSERRSRSSCRDPVYDDSEFIARTPFERVSTKIEHICMRYEQRPSLHTGH